MEGEMRHRQRRNLQRRRSSLSLNILHCDFMDCLIENMFVMVVKVIYSVELNYYTGLNLD